MPAKSAIGKNTKVSYPASGTVKQAIASPAIASVSLQRSKSSNQSNSSKIDKEEQADAAEIVALADFNRVYGSSKVMTEFGQYYGALDVVHSITTDDVTYVVNKSIEKDASGQWATLRDDADASIADAEDLNEDLANVDAKIEQACKSLNFLRVGDSEIQEEAEKYLEGKIRTFQTPASNRVLDVDDMLPTDLVGTPPSQRYASTGGSVEALKSVLSYTIASGIVLTPSDDAFYGLGQSKSTKNLNPSDPKGVVWDYIDKMTGGTSSSSVRLSRCAKLLSHVFSISAGIQKVKQDSISNRILFNQSRLGAIFEGTSEDSHVPYRRSKSSPNYGTDLISLSLAQFDTSDGSVVVPVEFEDDVSGNYKSGIKSLIRDPIMNGDYTFSDFAAYAKSFEESRQDIENYSELMLGYLDPENDITPEGVLRTIISNFTDALDAAKSNETSRFQLLYTSVAGNSSGTSSKLMRQRLLQIAGRIKYYQLKRGESSTGSGDDAVKKTSLLTTKTSTGSESLTSGAEATTIQIEDKSDADTERIITRTAAASPPSDILAVSMVSTLTSIAQEGGPTAETLNYQIQEVNEDIEAAQTKVSVYSPIASTNEKYKDYVEYYRNRVASLTAYRDDLNEQLSVTPDYVAVADVRSYFEEAMKTTSGTFWSYMVKAYDDIIESAQKRLPSNVKLTDEIGKTLHGSFDEFGVMSLVVESFVALAAPLKLSVQKSATGTVTWDEAFENTLNFTETYEALLAVIESSIPNIAVIGYSSSNISDYRDELIFLTSDKTPEEIDELEFDSAESAKYAFSGVRTSIRWYQNAMAYLSAFSTIINRSKDDLISAFSNILESSSRREALDNERGRKMMSTLTNQQMVYRRSLVDKYRPSPAMGYIPARFVYSEPETSALDDILSSAAFCSKQSENTRLITAAIPAGTIDSTKRYNDPELGQQSYTGMVELVVHRRDHELDDLIFEEKIFLFDPQLYVIPDSFTNYKRSRGIVSSDAALQVAKKLTYRLYSRDSAVTLSYNDFASNERYQSLTSKQIDEIVKNATLSYLLETYLFKTTGAIFDESVTLTLDDSISSAGEAALVAVASQNLPDLVLPTGNGIDAIIGSDGEVDYFSDVPGVTTGDRELIAALGSSYIMRNEKLVDRLTRDCSFDRVFIVAIDPDSFNIDRSQTVSKNGNAGRQMLESLQKQGLLRREGSKYRVIPRDPLSGGFSIGDVSCQFIPHTASTTEGSLLKLSKDISNLKNQKAGSVKSKNSESTRKRAKSSDKSITKTVSKSSKGVKL